MPEQIAKGTVAFNAQFNEFRITGFVPHAYARGIDPNLDVPLISHVEGNLYQGGCMGYVDLPADFKHVVSLYPWEQYNLPAGCSLIQVEMYDSLDQGVEQIDALADLVVEWLEDGPTLVHCQAGLNRSGLLAATVLVKLGHTPDEAIALLRKRSPLVLCNEAFEEHARGLA